MTEGERMAIVASFDIMDDNGCMLIADDLREYFGNDRIALTNIRDLDMNGNVVYGRVEQTTQNILVWEGYNKHTGDKVNWVRTMAHEMLHILYGDYGMPHSKMFEYADICAGLK